MYFIFNFTKYIEWSGDYKNGDFVIAVLGNSDVFGSLQSISQTKTVGSQPIKVVKINNINEATKCNMIYITPSKSGELASITEKFANTNTLIVSDDPNACTKGACINLVLVFLVIYISGRKLFSISNINITKKNMFIFK